MNDREIEKQIYAFIDEFKELHSVAQARELRKRLVSFISENKLTQEQLRPLETTGVGEMLYTIASMKKDFDF